MVAVVQLVRASDCGSECRRFESDQPPQERNLSFSLFLFSFYKFTLEYIGLSRKKGSPAKSMGILNKKIAEFAIILELNGYSGCMEIG